MTIDQIAVPLMIIAAIAGGLLACAHIAGTVLYDAHDVKRRLEIKRHPHSRINRARPLISIVVSAHNDAESIMYTLNSILKASYRKVEMLIVDLGSEDYTRAIVKGYIELHPKQTIRLITRKQLEGGKGALRRAVKHYAGGELIMPIPAGGYVDEEALSHAVRHFAADEAVDALNTNRLIESRASVIGLFERYVAMLSRRSDKFLSEAGLLVTVRRMTLYRKRAYLTKHNNSHLNVRYAHDVRVGVPALASYRKVFGRNYLAYVHVLRDLLVSKRTWLTVGYVSCSAALAVTGPLLVGYFLYVALTLHEATLFLLCVMGLSAFMVISINEEGRFNPLQKIGYVIGIPVTFALFYLLTLARLLALIGAPFHRRFNT